MALGRLLRALATVFAVTVLAAAALALLLLVRGMHERWQLRRRPPPPPPEVDFDVVETARRVAGSIARDAEQQRRLLTDDGQPRNGIVACWHRFEEQAADTGVVREDWETSAEFTLRVLDLVEADSGPVTRLAALYREARFSDHPLDESHRTAALAALDAIHAQLRAPQDGAPMSDRTRWRWRAGSGLLAYAVLEIGLHGARLRARRAAPRRWSWPSGRRRSACCATASSRSAPPGSRRRPRPSYPRLGRPARGLRPPDRGHADGARPPAAALRDRPAPARRRPARRRARGTRRRRLSLAEIDDYLRRIEDP